MLALSDIRVSTPSEEGVLKVSKSSTVRLLIDLDEMKALLLHLGACWILNGAAPVTQATFYFSEAQFLEFYQRYIDQLKRGLIPLHSEFKTIFSTFFTAHLDAVYAQPVSGERFLIRPLTPVVQLQKHDFFVSEVDGLFHSMVLSAHSIPWGLQFAFPGYYQDPRTEEILKVKDHQSAMSNRQLYLRLTEWVRRETVATPFIYCGEKKFNPMRLGKNCFAWIGKHAALRERGIQVAKLFI